VAVKEVMATVRVADVAGMVKAVTVGAIVSEGGVEGWLLGSPGYVPAKISWMFVKPSPSESRLSILEKLRPAFAKAAPYGLRAGGPELEWQTLQVRMGSVDVAL